MPPESPKQPEQKTHEYSAAHYAQTVREKRLASKQNWKWLYAAIVILVFGGVAAWLFARPKHTTKPSVNTAAQTQNSSPPAVKTAATKTYTSTQFGLSFKYPETWKVDEPSGGGTLLAISPALSLKDASGKTKQVAIVYKIRNKQQALPEFDAGNAQAALESQKVSYTNPSQTQRAQTYISFLQFASSMKDGIDGIYVTGDAGYQIGQAIPKADIAPIDPVISVSFVECSTGGCLANGKAATLSTGAWKSGNLANTITELITSLIVQ